MKILIFMGIGIIGGLVFGEGAVIVKPLGDLFIRLLLMAAIPLVFFNLLAAISNLSDVGLLGRLGIKIFAYYLLTTAAALTLGLAITSWIQPGRGFELSEPVSEELGAVPGVVDVLLKLVPTNIVQAFAEGKVAQIVVFAVLLGVGSLLLGDARREPLQKLFGAIAELLRMLVTLILKFGPVGIGALAAASVGEYGSKLFGPLALFIGSVWIAQLLMVWLYMLLLIFVGRMSPLTFLKQTGPLYATTAATCSSLASLAVALDVAEKRLKLPEAIYSFTLPLGAQLNKDGTSVMLSAILLFTAQAGGRRVQRRVLDHDSVDRADFVRRLERNPRRRARCRAHFRTSVSAAARDRRDRGRNLPVDRHGEHDDQLYGGYGRDGARREE